MGSNAIPRWWYCDRKEEGLLVGVIEKASDPCWKISRPPTTAMRTVPVVLMASDGGAAGHPLRLLPPGAVLLLAAAISLIIIARRINYDNTCEDRERGYLLLFWRIKVNVAHASTGNEKVGTVCRLR